MQVEQVNDFFLSEQYKTNCLTENNLKFAQTFEPIPREFGGFGGQNK